jgi:hypothetical protein
MKHTKIHGCYMTFHYKIEAPMMKAMNENQTIDNGHQTN